MDKHQQTKDAPDTTVYFDPQFIRTKAGIFEFAKRVLPPKRIEEDCGYKRPKSVRSADAEKDYNQSKVAVSDMSSNTDTVSAETDKVSNETKQDGALRCLGSPDLARRRILFHDGLSVFLKSIKHAKSNSAYETPDNEEVSSADAKSVSSPITDGCGDQNQAHSYSKVRGDYSDIQTPTTITQHKKYNEFPTKQNDIESSNCKEISSSSPISKSKRSHQRSDGINSSIHVAKETKKFKEAAVVIPEKMSSAKEHFETPESMSCGKLQPANLIRIYDAKRLSPMNKGIFNISNMIAENCSYSPSASKLKSQRSWQRQNKYISPTIKPLRVDENYELAEKRQAITELKGEKVGQKLEIDNQNDAKFVKYDNDKAVKLVKSCMKSCQKPEIEADRDVKLGKVDNKDSKQLQSCIRSYQNLKPESQRFVKHGKFDAGEDVKSVNTDVKSLEEIVVKSYDSFKPTPISPSAKNDVRGGPLKSVQIQKDATENACQTQMSTNSDIKKLCEKLVGPAGLKLDQTESASVGHANVNYFINVENINVTFKN